VKSENLPWKPGHSVSWGEKRKDPSERRSWGGEKKERTSFIEGKTALSPLKTKGSSRIEGKAKGGMEGNSLLLLCTSKGNGLS